MIRRFAGAALTAAATLAPVAALAALAERAGSPTWTSVSGSGRGAPHDALTTAGNYGLRAVTLWQYSHRPCALGVEEAPVRADAVVPLEPLHACDPTGGQEWKRGDVGARRFVTAVATCVGKGKDRSIHGLSVWGAALGTDGKLVPVRDPVVLQFRECGSWQPKRECAPGTIATGIRGYWPDMDHGMTGVALRCQSLEVVASNGSRHAG
jgi:hypothetical protein